jgi:ribosomal-protein-alanine N-acetyltransferase
MRLSIRRFRLADLDRVMEIERSSFARAAYPRALFLELFQKCGAHFFVARFGPSIAGYSVACSRPPRAELVSIAVAPNFRRQGAAEALLQRTLVRLRKAGARRLNLTVRRQNRSAIALYRRFGFRNKGRVPAYYENGEDGLRMTLLLSDPEPDQMLK